MDANNPAGLVHHKELLKRTKEMGVSVREWIESVLENHPRNDN